MVPEPESPSGEVCWTAAGGWVLLPGRRAVRAGDREVVVTTTQFRLLALLCQYPGQVFNRTELVERAIGSLVSERTVDVHIKDLRRKLGPEGRRIETVRRQGYRYVPSIPPDG